MAAKVEYNYCLKMSTLPAVYSEICKIAAKVVLLPGISSLQEDKNGTAPNFNGREKQFTFSISQKDIDKGDIIYVSKLPFNNLIVYFIEDRSEIWNSYQVDCLGGLAIR